MGPPPFGDGNPGKPGRTWEATLAGFNGATAFRRWKLLSTTPRHIIVDPLQWGHRLSAMETVPPPSNPLPSCIRFNGATAFRRWKQYTVVASPDTFRVLQRKGVGPPPFGDGNDTGLTPNGGYCGCFNGATAFRRWKLEASANYSEFWSPLQWGHRLSAMETPAMVPISRSACKLQWGPLAAFRRWKLLALGAIALIAWELQWGHRLSAMETALCGSSAPWIHAKALFSRRIGYRINGHSVRDQLGFAAP